MPCIFVLNNHRTAERFVRRNSRLKALPDTLGRCFWQLSALEVWLYASLHGRYYRMFRTCRTFRLRRAVHPTDHGRYYAKLGSRMALRYSVTPAGLITRWMPTFISILTTKVPSWAACATWALTAAYEPRGITWYLMIRTTLAIVIARGKFDQKEHIDAPEQQALILARKDVEISGEYTLASAKVAAPVVQHQASFQWRPPDWICRRGRTVSGHYGKDMAGLMAPMQKLRVSTPYFDNLKIDRNYQRLCKLLIYIPK